jgi:hypothetical protein
MTITESKLKTGTLTFTIAPDPAVSFECQATNVRITPSYDSSGDALETLCGDTLAEDETRSDALNITAIQDFTDPDGFVAWSWEHDLESAVVAWLPTGVTGPTYAGTVKVKAVEVGGDVNKRLTTDAEWAFAGKATYTPAP